MNKIEEAQQKFTDKVSSFADKVSDAGAETELSVVGVAVGCLIVAETIVDRMVASAEGKDGSSQFILPIQKDIMESRKKLLGLQRTFIESDVIEKELESGKSSQ